MLKHVLRKAPNINIELLDARVCNRKAFLLARKLAAPDASALTTSQQHKAALKWSSSGPVIEALANDAAAFQCGAAIIRGQLDRLQAPFPLLRDINARGVLLVHFRGGSFCCDC